jgi:hypothetical protein
MESTKVQTFLSYAALVGGCGSLGYFLGAEGSIGAVEAAYTPSTSITFSPSASTIVSLTAPPLDKDDYNVGNMTLGIAMLFLLISLVVTGSFSSFGERLMGPVIAAVGSLAVGILLGYKEQVTKSKMNLYWATLGLLVGGVVLTAIATSMVSMKQPVHWGAYAFITAVFATAASMMTYLAEGGGTLKPGTDNKYFTISMALSWGAVVTTGIMAFLLNRTASGHLNRIKEEVGDQELTPPRSPDSSASSSVYDSDSEIYADL